MKALTMKEMRAVEGGTNYRTLRCGYKFTDKSWTGWLIAMNHYNWCSQCKIDKKQYGYWYTFEGDKKQY